jgi:hypothetical protein
VIEYIKVAKRFGKPFTIALVSLLIDPRIYLKIVVQYVFGEKTMQKIMQAWRRSLRKDICFNSSPRAGHFENF